MIPILLGIIGCYALAAAAVHLAYVFTRKRRRAERHYVLLARNEQHMMEWYIRSIRRLSHRTGEEVKVTVINQGSEDDTLQIAGRFARSGMKVDISSGLQPDVTSAVSDDEPYEGEQVLVDLGKPAELLKLPL